MNASLGTDTSRRVIMCKNDLRVKVGRPAKDKQVVNPALKGIGRNTYCEFSRPPNNMPMYLKWLILKMRAKFRSFRKKCFLNVMTLVPYRNRKFIAQSKQNQQKVQSIDTNLALKANQADVTSSLALKANQADVTSSLALKSKSSGCN